MRREGAVGVVARVRTPQGTWSGAAGLADRSPRERAEAGDRFRAGSVSKQLVAVLALQQVDRDRWSLDTTLGEVLPTVWPERSGTTLRQLLGHTSGIPEFLLGVLGTDPSTSAFKEAISRPRTDAGLVAAARQQPVVAEPGTYSYSNTNYVLVGMMLREATGRRVDQLVRERVLEPAGMDQSSWPRTPGLPDDSLDEFARLYGDVVGLGGFDPSVFSTAGALVTTTRDLDRFQRALASGELLPRSLVRVMRTPVDPDNEVLPTYGLGSYRLPDPCRPGRWVHGHDGASFATFTLSFASTDGRRVSAAMTGRDYDGDTGAVEALLRLVRVGLAQTCGGRPQE